ncbi:MAG TPA: hypothetical protein VIL35_06815 [Vicinamibacterales bacterium]
MPLHPSGDRFRSCAFPRCLPLAIPVLFGRTIGDHVPLFRLSNRPDVARALEELTSVMPDAEVHLLLASPGGAA